MVDIGEIASLIESNRNNGVEFGTAEDGTSEEWIAKAEQRLKTKLPPSTDGFWRIMEGEIFVVKRYIRFTV